MPQQHFLRKLDAALDLSFVYEETARLYSRKLGRPPIDPVVIVKYLLVGFLYGIPSERQIEQHIRTDIALRWYLGLDLFDRVPDHIPSRSCAAGSRPSVRYFGGCSRRSCASVLRRALTAGGWSVRIRPTSEPTPPVRQKNW